MANWATTGDVEARLGVGKVKGYTVTDIEARLDRAEEDLRSELQTIYSQSQIDAWTTTTNVPKTVRNMVADLAAAYMFAEVFHQSYQNKESLACSFKQNYEDEVKKLRSGKKQIVDTAGKGVEEPTDRVWSSTATKTPTFSMEHPDDPDFGDASLDEF